MAARAVGKISMLCLTAKGKCVSIDCKQNMLVWWNGRHRGLKIRWGQLRTGSSPVTSTKKWDTPKGCPIFSVLVGIEPEVRVRGATRAPPVAGGARGASGSGLYFQGGYDRRRKYRAPQQDSGTKKWDTPKGHPILIFTLYRLGLSRAGFLYFLPLAYFFRDGKYCW